MLSRRKFLWTSFGGAVGACALPAFARRQPTDALTLYVGTYTSGKSEGIYIYNVNPGTGELRHFKTVKNVADPSYLAIDGRRRFLYAVNELTEFRGEPSGALSAFAIDPKTGDLSFLNQQSSRGGAPCYLTVDANNRFVLVANYVGGNIAVLPIQSDGTLGTAADVVQHHGSSVKKEQEGPHAHCIILDRSNARAFAADLGLDKVLIYRFDERLIKLLPGNQPWVQLKAGAGPRHFTFHPSGKYAYVINELDSTITAFQYESRTGRLTPQQTVSTLPKEFSGHNDCADLHVSPSGKFLYGSNRGHNSIVVFQIDERTNQLTYLEHTSTEGKTPRNFTIVPGGRFLLVANQESETIVTLRIDSITGRLKSTGLVVEVPTPVCLKFL